MNGVLLILKYLGFALLGILGLLLLALILPLTARLRYENGVFSVKLRVLFFWVTVFPQKEKRRKKESKRPKEEADEPKEEKEKKKSKIDVRMVLDLLPLAKSFLGKALRGISIRNVYLRLIAHGSDMAETGIATGKIWAAIGGGTAVLNNIFRVTYKDIVVVPDFMGQYKGKEKFDCKITVIPVILIIAAIGFLFRFLAVSAKGKAEKEPEKMGNDDKNEQQVSAKGAEPERERGVVE